MKSIMYLEIHYGMFNSKSINTFQIVYSKSNVFFLEKKAYE